MLAVVDGVRSKNRVEIPPQHKQSVSMKSQNAYGSSEWFLVNYEMTPTKSCHEVTIPIET